jgi:hypothetical protein
MRFPAWLRRSRAASVSRGYPLKTAQDRPQSVRTATRMRQTGVVVPPDSQPGLPAVFPRGVLMDIGSLSACTSAQGACARGFSTCHAIGPANQAERWSYPPPATGLGGIEGLCDLNSSPSGEPPDQRSCRSDHGGGIWTPGAPARTCGVCRAHNPKVAGSNPAPAMRSKPCTPWGFRVSGSRRSGRLLPDFWLCPKDPTQSARAHRVRLHVGG